jgi:predicted TIM-barrel fold metal-dependent hydrolase
VYKTFIPEEKHIITRFIASRIAQKIVFGSGAPIPRPNSPLLLMLGPSSSKARVICVILNKNFKQ